VHVRPGLLPRLDGPLEVDLRVRMVAPRGADGGHAAGQIEPWGRDAGLGAAVGGGVEGVIVQPDDARDHRVAAQLEDLRPVRRTDVAGRPDLRDAAVLYENRAIRDSGVSGPVHDRHVVEEHRRRVHRDELADVLREVGTLLGGSRQGQEEGGGESHREGDGTHHRCRWGILRLRKISQHRNLMRKGGGTNRMSGPFLSSPEGLPSRASATPPSLLSLNVHSINHQNAQILRRIRPSSSPES